MSHAAQQNNQKNDAKTRDDDSKHDESAVSGISNVSNKCTIYLSKTASIAYLDVQGSSALKFNIIDSVTRQIFLPEHFSKNKSSLQLSNNILRRIYINKIYIDAGTSNSFPFPLGIKINTIPNQEYTQEGDAFVYIIPQKFTVSAPVCIFESSGDENLMKTWEEDFAKWNTDNLETLHAMSIPESDTVMVHVDHPVVQLLEKKYEEFNVTPPSQQNSSTPMWRQVDAHTFRRACSWLRDNILSKSSQTFDMTQMLVTFGRINNDKFTDLHPSFFTDMPMQGTETINELTDIKNKYANLNMQRPFTLDIKISILYRLPTQDSISKGLV